MLEELGDDSFTAALIYYFVLYQLDPARLDTADDGRSAVLRSGEKGPYHC
jgi:hypothetical protein